jgi:hypothetical protein
MFFKEVKLGFFVGHTHEDIHGCLGYLSKKLKEENNYILGNLMRVFMILQERTFILRLIQEIRDFKFYVLCCLKDGLKMLVRHINMMFRFFVDSSG